MTSQLPEKPLETNQTIGVCLLGVLLSALALAIYSPFDFPQIAFVGCMVLSVLATVAGLAWGIGHLAKSLSKGVSGIKTPITEGSGKLALAMIIPAAILLMLTAVPKVLTTPVLAALIGICIIIPLLSKKWRKQFPILGTISQQMRPFILIGLFLIVPIVIPWMLVHSLLKLRKKSEKTELAPTESTLRFRQYVAKGATHDEHFFSSPAFACTAITLFALGIPFAVVCALYVIFGLDALWGNLSADARFKGFVFVHYLTGLSACLATLFFRAYFLFPLNFADEEYAIEIDERFVRKTNVKGWFAELMWYGWHDFCPREIPWSSITAIDYEESGFGRLYPLQPGLFSADSWIFTSLNKLAAYTDAVVDKCGRAEFLVFKTGYDKNTGGGLKVRLWDLNDEDKARMFYAIRKWAPGVRLDNRVQEKLVGSAVMKDAQYTEIWFDILTSRSPRLRLEHIQPEERLKNGKYSVLEKLGAGGQATAYLAEDTAGNKCVLKEFILSTDEGLDALVESARDFENESSILRQLQHTKIVQLKEIFLEDHRAYLVLELIEGDSLRHLIETSGALDEARVIDYALQMCDILKYLHNREPQIVHRDFTPDNLLLTKSGQIKLIDFSIARHVCTETADCAGKHAYVPPEQFRGELDCRNDLYAFGATLQFLLTGADPVPITVSHPLATGCEVSPELDQIIAKCTALTAAARYENVGWLQIELETLQTSQQSRIRTSGESNLAPAAAE